MASNQVTDTTTGFVINCPYKTIDKAVIVDLKATLASERLARNVLTARVAAKSQNNLALEQTFKLAAVTNGGVPNSYTFNGVPGNIFTIFASNYPVRLVLTTPLGSVDLGQNLMFVLSSTIVSLQVINDQNYGDAECNIVHV